MFKKYVYSIAIIITACVASHYAGDILGDAIIESIERHSEK